MPITELMTHLTRDMLLLFAVVNPLGNIPVYAELTEKFDPVQRKRIIDLAVLISLVMVIIFSIAGNICLDRLFGITLMEFRIAGGILLFLVALQGVMLPHGSYIDLAQDRNMMAVFPLAFPMMVGPGALTMTMIMAQKSGPLYMIAMAFMTFAAVFLIAHNSHRLMKIMGPYIGKVISRLLYIFLAAKAVSMILGGISEYVGEIARTLTPG